MEVLEWVRGRSVERARLHQLFGAVQFLRTVNRYGFISVPRFYIYAEQGLSRQRVAIWIYEGELRLEYQETLLARYRCAYDQRQRRLRDVSDPMCIRRSSRLPSWSCWNSMRRNGSKSSSASLNTARVGSSSSPNSSP